MTRPLTRLAPLLIAAGFAAGCGPTIKLTSPLSLRETDRRAPIAIAVHVPPESRSYEATGWINVVKYRVEFGDSLEANATDAYRRAFSGVGIVDEFPPAGPRAPRIAFSVEIAETAVSPGALTFMASSAEVALRGRVAVDGVTQPAPLEVRGTASVSPGALGALPGPNQGAYDQALQDACEGALRDALD